MLEPTFKYSLGQTRERCEACTIRTQSTERNQEGCEPCTIRIQSGEREPGAPFQH